MRMFLLSVALFFPTLVTSQTIMRQGYTGGTPTLGGCTGLNPTDNNTLVTGQCFVPNGQNASYWINDCWSNGVITATSYVGSTTCDPAFVSSLIVDIAAGANGNTTQSYCNLDTNPMDFDTFNCSATTTPPANQVVQAFAYPKPASTNCSGTFVQTNLPVGVCTAVPGVTPPIYTIANCANGLVTSLFYTTSNCSVTFNSTGYITNPPTPFGPFAQINATSSANKLLGATGSSCANFNTAYISYQCVTITPSSTAGSSSTAAAGSGSGSGSSSTAATSSTGASSSTTGTSSTGVTAPPTTNGTTGTTKSPGNSSTTAAPNGTTTAPPSGNTTTSPPTSKSGAAVVTTGIGAVIILVLAQFA